MMNYLALSIIAAGAFFGECSSVLAQHAITPKGSDKDQPSAYDTLLLEYVNRARLDPDKEARRIVDQLAKSHSFDRKLFLKQMKRVPPAPPLVFDLLLNRAARNHALYLYGNRRKGAAEDYGILRYSGRTPEDRLKKVGFFGAFGSEITMQKFASVEDAYKGFLLTSEEDRNTKNSRPSALFDPRNRVTGVSCLLFPKEIDRRVANLVLGIRDHRRLGGVVFDDRDGDRFYDIGEGIAGVELRSSADAQKSWKSGAFAVLLPDTSASISFVFEGRSFNVYFPDGLATEKFDILQQDVRAAGGLEQEILQALALSDKTKDEKQRFILHVNLYAKYQYRVLPTAVAKKLLSKVSGARKQLEADQEMLRKVFLIRGFPAALLSLDSDPASLRAIRRYQYTLVEDWFRDALRCLELNGRFHVFVNAYDIGGAVIPMDQIDIFKKGFWKTVDPIKTAEWKRMATIRFKTDLDELVFFARRSKE